MWGNAEFEHSSNKSYHLFLGKLSADGFFVCMCFWSTLLFSVNGSLLVPNMLRGQGAFSCFLMFLCYMHRSGYKYLDGEKQDPSSLALLDASGTVCTPTSVAILL